WTWSSCGAKVWRSRPRRAEQPLAAERAPAKPQAVRIRPMTLPLYGRRIALAEGRQLEELAELLALEGATPLRYPLLSILDVTDPAPVVAWLRELIADRFATVVLMTGEGVRRLLGFAEREGLRDAAI